MKIGELNMRCGNCAAIEYCGEIFCYAICEDNRFSEVDDEEYADIADTFDRGTGKKYGVKYSLLPECKKSRKRGDCDGYYSDECKGISSKSGDNCNYYEEAKDNLCWAIADYVEAVLKKRKNK